MFSDAQNLHDCLMESKSRFMILMGLVDWRQADEAGETTYSASQATLALAAGISDRQASRLLQELCGKGDHEPVLECVQMGRGAGYASVYRLLDDRLLRVANCVRTARATVKAGLAKHMLGLGILRPQATIQNARDIMLACAEACLIEGYKRQAAEIMMAMVRPFFGESGEADVVYVPGVTGDILSGVKWGTTGDIMSGVRSLLVTFSGATGDIQGFGTSFLSEIPDSAPTGRATRVYISAREAGASEDLLKLLDGVADRVRADGQLGLSVGAFAKARIEGERGYLDLLGQVARGLGCSGVVLGAKAGEPPLTAGGAAR